MEVLPPSREEVSAAPRLGYLRFLSARDFFLTSRVSKSQEAHNTPYTHILCFALVLVAVMLH